MVAVLADVKLLVELRKPLQLALAQRGFVVADLIRAGSQQVPILAHVVAALEGGTPGIEYVGHPGGEQPAARSQQVAGQLRLKCGVDGPVNNGVRAKLANEPVCERRDLGAVQPQGRVGG